MAIKRASKKARQAATFIMMVVIMLLCITYFVLKHFGIDVFEKRTPHTVTDGTIEVHMIDVGQGDCILIVAPEGNVLIDAGDGKERNDAAIKTYLTDMNITAFDYVIFTHPDSDHIGGGDTVMYEYDVENVIMPNYNHGTKTYEQLVTAIDSSDARLIYSAPCAEYTVGEMYIKILAPLSASYSDTNDYSVVVRIDFGESSFLMTGDAEKKSESEMLSTYSMAELDCDVLKVGHHGSRTSSCAELLDAVSPEIALISCGVGNSYGHPTDEVLARLNERNVTVYRTDELGDIVLTTDGKTITKK